MAKQGRHAHILNHFFQRLLQLFLIFIFVVTELRDGAQIINRFAGFASDFIQLRLRNA
jgi:hypothetical protein